MDNTFRILAESGSNESLTVFYFVSIFIFDSICVLLLIDWLITEYLFNTIYKGYLR